MIGTRNKRAINNIAFKSIKANKMRNIFAIVAIALTTILFTSLLTIGISMSKSIEQSTMRQVGGSAHGTFKFLTIEEFNQLKDHKLIKDIGYSIFVSPAENKELLRRPTEMRYATDKGAKFMFSLPTTGRMPEEENEIATDTIVLDKLKIPHKIGEKVTLSYVINGRKVTRDFILSGYFKGDNVATSSMAWVSEKFVKTNLAGIDQKYVKKHMKEVGFTGLIFADVMFSNSFNVEKKMLTVLNDNGYTKDDIPIGVNWAYTASNIVASLGTILSIIGAILLITFSGYLIIYNIFYISIAKDTKFYGVLKTIGTTPKQIRSIVKKQAIILCIIGIPIGLVMGYILGSILLPFAMQVLAYPYAKTDSNPLIFIGSALFSIITVWISCRKPRKIASKISPIEAVRYTDASISEKRNKKKSINGAKLHKMALSNIFRNKKKALIVITSLSLSIILFNSVYTIVTGFDMDKYVSGEICSDFAIADVNYFNPQRGYNGQDTVTENIVNEIGSVKGIKDVGRIYYKELKHKLSDQSLNWFKNSIDLNSNDFYTKTDAKEALKSGEITLHISGLDKFIWNKFEIKKGKFDGDKFATGDYVIISFPCFETKFPVDTSKMQNVDREHTYSYYDVGENIKITYDNGNEKNYKVMAIASMPHNIGSRKYYGDGTEVYIPSDEFKSNINRPIILTTLFDVEDKYIDNVENYLADYIKTKEPLLGYESRDLFVKEFKKTQTTYNTVGYSLSFVVALIGILNFTNSMITSIISRRREHAMFQSIGMTSKQLNRMLIFEGLYYSLFTILMVSTIGMGLNYLIVDAIAASKWFFTYHFTLIPILICTPFLVAISVIIPVVCHKTTSKMSIVERLREIE
ncbi:ABC transporter permease [Clostridium lundense]|uniref:ABC transporter permease n=1 Tax=Clostridium lundense TaxID=319475 RepID=UPI000687192F|nr:ABC transporter permease [Clostridium lundense]